MYVNIEQHHQQYIYMVLDNGFDKNFVRILTNELVVTFNICI